jgi:hypothetical protein
MRNRRGQFVARPESREPHQPAPTGRTQQEIARAVARRAQDELGINLPDDGGPEDYFEE